MWSQAYFTGQDDYDLIGILACHIDMKWGRTKLFKSNVKDMLKNKFKFDSEETEAFTYVNRELLKNSEYKIH